jgi:hypothetical protein
MRTSAYNVVTLENRGPDLGGTAFEWRAIGTHRVIDQRSPSALPRNSKYIYIRIDLGSGSPQVTRVLMGARTYPASNPWLRVLTHFRWADAKPAVRAL